MVTALRRNSFLAISLLVAGLAAYPLMSEPGLLNTTRGGGDSPFLLQRLHQMETALLDGHFPVRWMPDANYGYGFPFYNYYAPLSFYISAIFRFIGFSYVRAIQLSHLSGFITAAAGMFFLGKRWLGSRWAGLVASVSYTAAPFHLVNVYVRGDSLAEFWAMAIYPLVILSAEHLIEGGRRGKLGKRAMALFALSYGGLILTHNISALIFSPFLLLFLLLRWWIVPGTSAMSEPSAVQETHWLKSKQIKSLAGLMLALALAASFFLPALAETALSQIGPATEGHFFYGNHFRGADLIQTEWLFDYNPDGEIAFSIGLVQAILASVGSFILIVALARSARSAPVAFSRSVPAAAVPNYLFIFLTTIIATWMITSFSKVLWDELPLLPFTQFPWRFLSVQTMAISLATAAIAWLPKRRTLVPLAIGLVLVSALGRLETAHLILTDADVTARKLAEYEWFTGNIGTTVSAEYLPKTVQPRSYTSPWLTGGDRERVQPLSGELITSQQLERKATRQVWSVAVRPEAASSTATVSFPTIFWPGWRATIDGEKAEVRPARGSGLITIDLTPGEHEVTLWLARTPVRMIADAISLIAALVIGWMLISTSRLRVARQHMAVVAFIAVLAVGLRLWPETKLSASDLTWDFAQMGYLHHTPAGISFDSGAILHGYEYSGDEVDAGEPFLITVEWDAGPDSSPVEMALSLELPAIQRYKEAPAIASTMKMVNSGRTTFELLVPKNAPGGLYAPRLVIEQGRARMSENRLRGDLYLRPVRVREKYLAADGVEAPLAVRAEQVQQRDSRTVDVQLAWLTQKPLGQNYNMALRLLDSNGLQLSQFDSQPGYGFVPSTSWPAGRWANVWTAFSIPDNLVGTPPYTLMGSLYEVDSLSPVLTRSLGQLVAAGDMLRFEMLRPIFAVRDGVVPVPAEFESERGRIIQLHGYEVDQEAKLVDVTLYWGALMPGQAEYTRFVHLSALPGEQQPAVQSDGMARGNSYPTGQWVAGEVVVDPVTLHLEDVSEGEYQLFVGWYRNLGDRFPRLAAYDPGGNQYPSDRVPLPFIVTIPGN